MPLPSVPRSIEEQAASNNLGRLLWMQPAAVQGSRVSEQGDYFYSHGLVVAHGLRMKVEVRLWRDVADLDWDLYIKAWNTTGTPAFQRVRVWHIDFKDGTEHTSELPERQVAAPPFESGDQVRAEKEVWSAILHDTRGNLAQQLEDTQMPISAGPDVVLYHNRLTVLGTDYKWPQLKAVWSDVDEKTFTPRREDQMPVVRMSFAIPQRSNPLAVRFGYSPSTTTQQRVLHFAPDQIDLPLMYHMASEMPFRRKHMGD